MTTERDFDKAVSKAPQHIRDEVYAIAWENSWAAETYNQYASDVDRWEAAIFTAELVIDSPSDWGIQE